MGICCCKKKSFMRVLLLGLDAAGKTTVLYSLKSGEGMETVPTIGFNVEKIKVNKTILNVWDVGGQDKLRDFWRNYYPGTNGVVFIIDSNDTQRLIQVKNEIHLLSNEDELKYATFVFIANKQDLPNALSGNEIEKRLELNKLNREYKVFEATATKHKGLNEAINWLNDQMKPI